MITQEGGLINVELATEQYDYYGSDRFGVQSRSYQGRVDGIRFLGNPIVQDRIEERRREPRRPSGIERAVGDGVRRGIERTISDSIRDIFR